MGFKLSIKKQKQDGFSSESGDKRERVRERMRVFGSLLELFQLLCLIGSPTTRSLCSSVRVPSVFDLRVERERERLSGICGMCNFRPGSSHLISMLCYALPLPSLPRTATALHRTLTALGEGSLAFRRSKFK